MSASTPPDAGAAADQAPDDELVAHAGRCIRPFCCNPFAAFSEFSRVGGWTPALPDTDAPADT